MNDHIFRSKIDKCILLTNPLGRNFVICYKIENGNPYYCTVGYVSVTTESLQVTLVFIGNIGISQKLAIG